MTRPARGVGSARHPWRFEPLEPRLLLSSSGVVGDATFALYDAAVTSTVNATFSRDVETVDGFGQPVAADERRFGEALAYAPELQWSPLVQFNQPGEVINIDILASGWDHDGVTPLAVMRLSGSRDELQIVRGADMEIVNTISLEQGDLLQRTVENRLYRPEAAIVNHGLIVFGAERKDISSGSSVATGVDFFYSSDYGQTIEFVPMVDGTLETPLLGNGGADGLDRMREWAFMNPFPVSGLDTSDSAWFPWGDYLGQGASTKGGQIGLFRADRDPTSGEWTISPNRVIYQEWNSNDAGGFHSHGAAVTNGGLISHWGDSGERNVTMFHEFNLENYQTATVTTVDAFGDYDPERIRHAIAPQPVATAPSPIPGEHFAAGDNTPDHVLSFGALADTGDKLDVESIVYQPERFNRGNIHAGATILHLHWLQGVGYVAAGRVESFFYFSPDGENWAEIASPEDEGGTLWLYGDRLIKVRRTTREIVAAETPTVETVNPLKVSPGDENLLASELESFTEPGEGNTRRRVVYEAEAWRYADTSEALDVQAPPPEFGSDAAVYEITVTGDSVELGGWWLTPEGSVFDADDPYVLDAWVALLSDQGAQIGMQQQIPGESSSKLLLYQVFDTTQWTSIGMSDPFGDSGEGRVATVLSTQNPGAGSRFLVAIPYFGKGVAASYPQGAQQAGPDEVESVAGIDLQGDWSAAFVARWPENAQYRTAREPMPIASLVGATGDAVEVSFSYNRDGAEMHVDFYESDELARSEVFEIELLRGDVVEMVVSESLGRLNLSIVSPGQPSQSISSPSGIDLQLNEFRWSARDGDVVTSIDPVLVVVDEDAGWTTQQHKEWFGLSLADKALFQAKPSPGDFNFDGVVNQADFVVWETTRYVPNPGGPGDADGNGYVDQIDGVFWQVQYGQREVIAADANGNGVVDIGDYTTIVDMIGQPLPPRPGDANRDGIVDVEDYNLFKVQSGQTGPNLSADFNGNGTVEITDYTVWRDNYGVVYADDPADVNHDGVVDALDLRIWTDSFGRRAPELEADFNDDGVVDILDYTVWRDNSGPQVVPGTGADADRDGYVELPDAIIWQANLGVQYLTLDDLRETSQPPLAKQVQAIHESEPPTDTAIAKLFAVAGREATQQEAPAQQRAERSSRDRALELLIDAKHAQVEDEREEIESPLESEASDEESPPVRRVGV